MDRRPQPRSRSAVNGRAHRWRKYVAWCGVCGGASVINGMVFIAIYLALRCYTTSLHLFESIPSFMPGIVFIVTGVIILCFTRRQNRYKIMLNVGGGCSVCCAVLCVCVTVATTVLHMSRLQGLHECAYTAHTQTCICVSSPQEPESTAERFVFAGISGCEVVQGPLSICLRALFTFSVLGVLICIADAFLLHQLSQHTKKREYTSQLEARRRLLSRCHPMHCTCQTCEEIYSYGRLYDMMVASPEQQRRIDRFLANRENWMAQMNEPCNNSSPWRNLQLLRPPVMTPRRPRSNDAVLHHLRYSNPYPWGPPPPYTPTSNQEVSVISSSKNSTPLSERRFLCHNFVSDGITLTINGGSPTELDNKDENSMVEVHGPYIMQDQLTNFNTLPVRKNHKKGGTPFKSVTSIPLELSAVTCENERYPTVIGSRLSAINLPSNQVHPVECESQPPSQSRESPCSQTAVPCEPSVAHFSKTMPNYTQIVHFPDPLPSIYGQSASRYGSLLPNSVIPVSFFENLTQSPRNTGHSSCFGQYDAIPTQYLEISNTSRSLPHCSQKVENSNQISPQSLQYCDESSSTNKDGPSAVANKSEKRNKSRTKPLYIMNVNTASVSMPYIDSELQFIEGNNNSIVNEERNFQLEKKEMGASRDFNAIPAKSNLTKPSVNISGIEVDTTNTSRNEDCSRSLPNLSEFQVSIIRRDSDPGKIVSESNNSAFTESRCIAESDSSATDTLRCVDSSSDDEASWSSLERTAQCSVDCSVPHLHQYRPNKVGKSNFVVTIKSMNI